MLHREVIAVCSEIQTKHTEHMNVQCDVLLVHTVTDRFSKENNK